MTLAVTANDLDMFLDLDGTINVPRAEMLIGDAVGLCSSVVSPVPDAAGGIVKGIAGRAYSNPDGVAAHTIGPESVQYGSTLGGLYITKAETVTLKRLAGAGGAFSVDPTPDDAGTALPPWDLNIWGFDGVDEFVDPNSSEFIDGP